MEKTGLEGRFLTKMGEDLIRRSDVLSVLEKVFGQYGISFGSSEGGFGSAVPKAVQSIPADAYVKEYRNEERGAGAEGGNFMTKEELEKRVAKLEEENNLFYRALCRIVELPDEELQKSAEFMRKVAKDALGEYFRRLRDGGEAL